ncbi:hypothetical protein [Erythrobacter colymbi]|uniref:hypothetical protein n=1 Tax=Erythrobacter colymbi TaxID=1161202 RepID=UPI001180AC11|nr:hypothetical protein [Erythrobacter colymbi]
MQGTMVGDGGVTNDPPPDSAARSAGEGELRRRKKRVKVRRQQQDKLSRRAQIALWIALPAFLWATMYLLYEALSWMS